MNPNSPDVIIQGVSSYIDVRFSQCVNGTVPGVVCKDQGTIDNLLNGYSFYMFWPQYSIDATNYDNPVSTTYNYLTYYIDTTTGKWI